MSDISEHDLIHSHNSRVQLIAALANWGALKAEDRAPILEIIEEKFTVEQVFDNVLAIVKMCGFDIELQPPPAEDDKNTYLTGAYL